MSRSPSGPLALAPGSALLSMRTLCECRVVLLLQEGPHKCPPENATERENDERNNDVYGAYTFFAVERPASEKQCGQQSPAENAVEEDVAPSAEGDGLCESFVWFHREYLFVAQR